MNPVPEMRRVFTPAKRRRRRRINVTGLKRWFVPNETVLTPYALKERRRRRALRKVAHESRRRNRA